MAGEQSGAGRRLTVYLDVGFRRRRLAVEIDGREFHSDRKLFETDRWRQNALVLDGWRVLRFTWRMISTPERSPYRWLIR